MADRADNGAEKGGETSGSLAAMTAPRRAMPKSPGRPKTVRAAEAVGFPGVVDPDEAGFRRLSGDRADRAAALRDLSPMVQEKMQQLAAKQWESNPLAQWIIETTIDFTLGGGVTVTALADAVEAVLTPFLDDPVNQVLARLESFGRDLCLYGELCLPAFVNPADGHVRLGYLDTSEISAVLTHPDNALIQTAVVRRPPVAGGVSDVFKIIRGDDARASQTFGQLLEAQPGERDPNGATYSGSCFLFQTNRLGVGRRGRSDLLALFDFLDGYDAFLFDTMQGAQQFNSWMWDVKVEGADEARLKDFIANLGTLRRGMVRAHNEKVTWQELAPDLKAMDKDTLLHFVRGQILGSRSFPEHWYGQGSDVNFASAKEMAAPPGKRLARRQAEFRRMLETLCRFQIHAAIRAKRLSETVQRTVVAADGSSSTAPLRADRAVTIVLPEISSKDQVQTVAAAVSLVSALATAQDRGYIRPETAAKLFAHLVSQLGLPIDAAAEYQPGAGPRGAALADYTPANLQRLLAQLARAGNGNGDNLGMPKPAMHGGAA